MTTAERLMAQGRAEGMAEGEMRGQREVLLLLLEAKFGLLPPGVVAAVRTADPAEQWVWARRVVMAWTLGDVFSWSSWDEGEMRGARSAVTGLLKTRFGELPIEFESMVQAADSDQLRMWGRRILTESTIEDVFA
ncbi:hypothetical protein [Nocardia cyriacigeorgica]|uniref:DUF4351 domain-containing protein n=1 Tax=Nocardia cyriacigeorgica TaxID=135487 RepID=A0A5R8NL92_9NOCA|nr:hypothetical protein [Nocardia cyriacigeorgica]TLF76449.1 hypothetical protein FEK34_16040 [Nocardia cyriacigeorgica]